MIISLPASKLLCCCAVQHVLSRHHSVRGHSHRFQYNPDLDISGTSKNHLAETMQQLYSGASTGYVIWNDQPLSKSSVEPKSLHAHSKGTPLLALFHITVVHTSA